MILRLTTIHALVSSAVLALVPALGVLGCSGGGGGGGGSSPQPPAGFNLLATDPIDGAEDVATSQVVRLTFSAAVDPNTVASGVAVLAGGANVAAVVTAAGAVVELAPPAGGWARATEHTVQLSTTLRDVSGRALGLTLSGRFYVERAAASASTVDLPGATARSASASVVLADGRILTTGGVNGAGALADAWVYDPDDGATAAVAPLATPRWGHSATLLGDGRVLVAGGVPDDTGGLASLELYDPLTDTWRTLGATLGATRAHHAAIPLPDGRVAFVGGVEEFLHGPAAAALTIERFDPRDETVTTVAPAGGSTVVAGQWFDLGGGRALCLAAASATWDLAAAAPLATPTVNQASAARSEVAGVRLAGGGLLLAGGLSGTSTVHDEVDLFDPSANRFSSAPSLQQARFGAVALRLVDERVAIVGGAVIAGGPPAGATTIEVYDAAGAAQQGSITTAQLDAPSAVALPGGGVLVTSSRTEHSVPGTSRGDALLVPSGLFTRSSRLHVTGVIPAGGLRAADPYGALRVLFSDPVEASSLQRLPFTLTGPDGAVALDVIAAPDGRSCAILPRQALRGRASYTLSATAGVRSAQSGDLSLAVGAPSVTFTTAPAVTLRPGGLLVVDRGVDRLFLAEDLDGDGDLDDPGEVVAIGDLGSGTPNEIASTPRGELFLADSGTDAIYRMVDLNGDGDVDDPGERVTLFDNTQTNLPGWALDQPGTVAIDADGSVLLGNNGGGGRPDFVLRLRDLDGQGGAFGPGEATVVDETDYNGAMYGFAVDPYGVLWHVVAGADAGLYRLEDLDGDGRTDGAGERSKLPLTGTYFDVTFTRGYAPIAWGMVASVNPRATRFDTAGNGSTFATSPAVGNGASLTLMADGSWLHSSTGSDQLFRLRDSNGDGDVDDAGEVTLAFSNAGALLSNPYFAGAGQGPITPRLHAPVARAQTALSGVTAPWARVSVQVNGGAAVVVVADRTGAFEAPLGGALSRGDEVTWRARGVGGSSALVRRVVP